MNNVIMVAMGGACGAVLRYWVVATSQYAGLGFPLGTLSVNVLGSLLIGVAAAYWLATGAAGGSGQLFFQTGLLGAFTTFSAFSLDTLLLWQNGQLKAAALNVMLNVMLCLTAVAAGLLLGGNLAK